MAGVFHGELIFTVFVVNLLLRKLNPLINVLLRDHVLSTIWHCRRGSCKRTSPSQTSQFCYHVWPVIAKVNPYSEFCAEELIFLQNWPRCRKIWLAISLCNTHVMMYAKIYLSKSTHYTICSRYSRKAKKRE